MRRIALVLTLLVSFATPALRAAETECSLCVGAVASSAAVPSAGIPLLLRTTTGDLATLATSVDTLTPATRAKIALVVSFTPDPSADALAQVETQVQNIVEWARLHGPFGALGVSVETTDASVAAYAVKRLSVTSQGLNVAARTITGPASVDATTKLLDAGATSYVDEVVTDAASVKALAAALAERDPSKKIVAIVTASSPNPLFDAAQALADGATLALLPEGSDANAVANVNRAFAGDYAFDSTSHPASLDAKGAAASIPSLVFVRGKDLRTLIVPKGDAAPFALSLRSDLFRNPVRFDATGEHNVTDSAVRGQQLLVGVQKSAPLVLALDRIEKPQPGQTKEAIDVATQRGITVEEIIRNHQSYRAYEASVLPRYSAKNTTKLRFAIANTSETVEATIAGRYFADANGKSDWVWEDFLVNGVRWKYGKPPELPLIQPEKVSQLPLDIHLTNEYRYELVRETDLLGYHVYEVRFEPPPNAPATLPLYRGTVWIDTKSWARIRISMIQLNLGGEVLSNEERVDFTPFLRSTRQPLTSAEAQKSDPRELTWIPTDVEAQQVISAAGRPNVVLRSTTFENIRLDPEDYDASRQEAFASNARMVRDTENGLRYLEKRGNERVVKEGFDTSSTFLVGGVYHDEGLDYPVVPLGGINHFDFNLFGKGIQSNIFFAGAVLAANFTNPDVHKTRTNVGVDMFGLAVPFTNSMYRGGVEQKDEAIKALPLSLTARVGHPVLNFGKVDFSVNVLHLTYQRAEDTAANFVTPSDTFVISPSLEASWSRWGWNFRGNFDYSQRTTWEAWGDGSEYDPDQKNFLRYGASFGKSFFLPKFQRIGIDVDYLDGQRLDRFSKYELGFFGAQRVRGVQSGTVRAERAILTHLSYGFVFSDQFRMEALYDHALIDDASAGYKREPFQGIGIAGQTIGPWGTLLRLDIGKTIGRNAQDGFVANVVFLKLF